MAKVISLINEKGGVGKTTSTNVIAACLKSRGFAVLCVDFDPQAHLSFSFGADTRLKPTIYDVIRHTYRIHDAIQQTAITDIIPSNDMLKSIEGEYTKSGNHRLLLDVLTKVQKLYDYILIDSPPELGLVSINALVASNIVLIPCLPDGFSLGGSIKVHETVMRIKQAFSPDLNIGGIIMLRYYPQQKLSKNVCDTLEQVTKMLQIPHIQSKIRHSNTISQATSIMQVNVCDEFADNTATQDYQALVEELLRKGII